jgi:hypothetical protein
LVKNLEKREKKETNKKETNKKETKKVLILTVDLNFIAKF